ncbi:DUF4351 domain-containing protein [Castellaniella caeni]
MAQLQAAGHPDKTTRLTPLIELHRSLYAYGYTRDAIAERHGMAKGLEQGLQRQANTLINQVQRRFGPLPDDVTQRIQTANASQLETWSLNFVDATELEDVFRD